MFVFFRFRALDHTRRSTSWRQKWARQSFVTHQKNLKSQTLKRNISSKRGARQEVLTPLLNQLISVMNIKKFYHRCDFFDSVSCLVLCYFWVFALFQSARHLRCKRQLANFDLDIMFFHLDYHILLISSYFVAVPPVYFIEFSSVNRSAWCFKSVCRRRSICRVHVM